MRTPTRREVLSGGLAAGVVALAGVPATAQTVRARSLRIAHLTDIHVQPEKRGGEGMAACLKHLMAQEDTPDFVFTGGDLVMDVWSADKERAKVQWDLFGKVLADGTDLPVHHCLGNHDYWNGGDKGAQADKFGYAWAMEELKMPKPFYSFDEGAWHFIVLESTQPQPSGGYKARLGEEQLNWLAADLESTSKDRPVLVLSHIPILAACAYFDGDNEKEDNWNVPGAWMHVDARQIKDVFRRHPNVKVCISGHIHLADEVDYLGVKYLCNGAVCGGWWGGNYQEFGPAYALLDLFEDGTVSSQLIEYGWEAG
ncbi:MAG: metallophosphoesterase [Fimbriimonadaceae bacterium]|nr:metallophosphoesterase [Fimbriimonadaceae bacterium]